jgi:hypothetical protein
MEQQARRFGMDRWAKEGDVSIYPWPILHQLYTISTHDCSETSEMLLRFSIFVGKENIYV